MHLEQQHEQLQFAPEHSPQPQNLHQNKSQSDSQSSSTQNIRFIYNSSPCTKQLLHSSAIPNAVHYTPFHYEIDPQIYNEKDVEICKKCGCYFNRHCQIINSKKLWICCICKQGNNLAILPVMSVEETYDIVCEGENVGTSINKKQKYYMFVIDLCVSAKQMDAIKTALLSFIQAKAIQNYQNVNLINRIAIITYNKFVYCYELGSQLNTLICIGGEKSYDMEQMYKFLAISPDNPKEIVAKYFVSIKGNKDKLTRRIKKIKAQGNVMYDNDPERRCRAKRAYGQALSVGLSICQGFSHECRIINLIGGPCTHGVGMTIGTNFKQQMRSISEHEQGQNVHYFESASKFYSSLKARASGRRTVLDFFIFSVQETGLTEMYDFVRSTGGLLVLGQQFAGQLKIFEKSFKKAYVQIQENQMICSLSTSCFITVSCSSDIKINGLLGPCKAIQTSKGRQYVSEKVIGSGDTNFWYLGAVNCYRTLTFMYDLASSKAFKSSYCIQFKTAYRDYWGFKKIRVTTVKRLWETDIAVIADGFDQCAAIVMLAKWYLYKYEYQPKIDLRMWIDKLLVKWASLYSNFIKQDPSSFTLPQKTKYLPQFIYHFRRNPLCLRQGLSLDQLTYHMHILNIQTVQHCLTIIQPSLLSYTIQNPQPTAVRLQEQQMKKNTILLLDTHFYVLLWYGEDIQYWEKQQYYKKKEYQNVKNLLDAPAEVVKYLVGSRWPYPGYYKTCTGHSKQRILKSKISPSLGEHSQNTLTDDKSSYTFMKVLREIIVNGKPSQN